MLPIDKPLSDNSDLAGETELDCSHISEGLDGDCSTTTSFASYKSGSAEIWEGRTYAPPPYGDKEHRYYLPIVDDDETMRQMIVHRLWVALESHVLPTTPPPGAFIDFGTGLGYWVQDVAEIFPEHRVVGIDLHCTNRLGVSGEFEVDDCEAEPFPTSYAVTLINLRDSYFWVRDTIHLISHARDLLQPGGYFQNQELRLSHWESNKPNFNQWRQEVLRAAKSLGIQLHSAEEVRNALNITGFQDYRERRRAKHVTKSAHGLFYKFLKLTVHATLRILVEGRTTTLDQSLALLDEVCKELDEEDCQITIQMHTCWARKGPEPQATN